jgi:DNA-binding NarL/FixJ family response regulator
MGKRIRVLVANRPRLIRELILGVFEEQPDIEIVGEVQEVDFENIARTVDETQPEFLILGLDGPERRPPLCDVLLRRHPEMKILAVAENNESSVFYWAKLDIRSTPLETSEAAILDALRGGKREFGRTM